MNLTFSERYRQARLYAAQVRARKAMGSKYDHAAPWRGPKIVNNRKLQCLTQNLDIPTDLCA